MVYKKVDMADVRAKAAGIQLLVLDVDGVLTSGRLHFDADGNECKVFHVRDGYGIRRLLDAGFEVAVISGRSSVAVEKRMAELGVKHVHLGARNKSEQFDELLAALDMKSSSAACVGDDTPDLEIMSRAGLAIAVGDAHADLDQVADWHTQNNGGEGAVREVCDLLLSTRN